MQQWIKTLTGLFVIQLVLVVLFNASLLKEPTANANTPLLSPEPKTATKVIIQAQNETPVTMVKQGETWLLPEYFNLAVNQEKLDGFLDKLSELQKTWPEATTQGAQTRFEVAEDKHQRQISLFYGEEGKTVGPVLYLGTSPGYQKTHARLADADEIYSVAFSNYEASVGPQTWFNTNLLQLELGRIHRIESDDQILEQIEGQWRLADLGPEETLDDSAVKVYVNQLANLSVEAAITDDAQSPEAQREKTATLKAYLTGSEAPITFDFALSESGTFYILKSSQSPLYFRLPKVQGDRLIDVKRADLIAAKDDAENTANAEDSGAADNTTLTPPQDHAHANMGDIPEALQKQIQEAIRQQQQEQQGQQPMPMADPHNH